MLVCLCHAVSDRDLARVISRGARSVEDVARCTGATTSCGSCRAAIGCAVAHARTGAAAAPCSERSQLLVLRTLAAVVG